MSDNDKNNFSDDEYQLPEDEYTPGEESLDGGESAFQGDAPVKKENPLASVLQKVKSRMPRSRNGRIGLVVGIIVLIGLIAHFASSDSDTIPLQANKTVKKQVVQPSPQPVIQPQPVQNDQNASSINALQMSSSKVSTEMANLKSEVDDLKSGVAQYQSSIAQLQKTVDTLNAQVATLKVKLNQTIARFSSDKKLGPELVYHLRAILPDRAWLVSNTGQTLSVTIGDTIDQYGVVQSINAQQGVIITSSGRKIYYGENDF